MINLGNNEQSFFSLKSVELSQGYLNLNIFNDLPFQISSLDLLLMSGENTIWSINELNIDPYTSRNPVRDLSDDPIVISMLDDIDYSFSINISPNQSGNVSDGNWANECFPDLDSPPIYLCDDILTPVDDASSFNVPNIFIADYTCNNQCSGDCLPLVYCGTDGYLGITGLSCSEFPYLGDFTDFTNPNINPPIYRYTTVSYDGFGNYSYNIEAYPLDSNCGGQPYDNDEGVCTSNICTSGLENGAPCSQDSDCNRQTCIYLTGNEQNCSDTCLEGLYSGGWLYQEIDTNTGDNGKLTISMEINATEVGEVIVEVDDGIQDVLNENILHRILLIYQGLMDLISRV